jgi:hypothetical protein
VPQQSADLGEGDVRRELGRREPGVCRIHVLRLPLASNS